MDIATGSGDIKDDVKRIGKSKLTGVGVNKTIKIGLKFLWLILVS